MRNFKSASANSLLYSSILTGGFLLVNVTAVVPAYAVACTTAAENANTTICLAGTSPGPLVYPTDNATYVGGDFLLRLEDHDVTPGGIVFGAGLTGDGTITLQGDSDVTNTTGTGIDADVIGAGNDITINVLNTSSVTGTAGDGISADSTFGNATVNVQDTGTVTGTLGDGIDATASRNVTVTTAAGTTVTGSAGDGIDANDATFVGTTASTISVTANGIVTGSAIGIDADSADGTVNVTTGANAITGTADDGIQASANDISGSATVTTAGGAVSGGGDGIEADANGSLGLASVTTGTGAVTGNFDGIDVQANGSAGTATVTTGSGAVTGTTADGIEAEANGLSGSATVTTGVGAISGGGDGIDIEANGLFGSATVTTGSGAVTGADSGIEADANGTFGITTAGALNITTGTGTVTGTAGDGIDASAAGLTGSVTITTNGTVQGFDTGIDASAGASGSIMIDINSQSVVQNLSGLDSDLAIRTAGGDTTINNRWDIVGRIETGGGDDTLNNSSTGPGFWTTEGTSDFGGGIDTVNNNSGAIIFAATESGVANTTTFANLENFNNSGVIDLQDQSSGDGSNISDTLSTSGDYAGSDGTLEVDAFLGGPGSVSDVFEVGGNTSGTTFVSVNNTNSGPGAANDGILVVDVLGNANEGDFELADGPIDTGFFVYDLEFDDTGLNDQFLLVSSADSEVFETTAAVAGAQEIWRETATAWEARQQAVRDQLNSRVVVNAVADPAIPEAMANNGLWIAGLGSWLERDHDAGGFDLSYEQQIYGVVGGADFGSDLGDGGTLLFGVLAGYVESDLDFDESSTSIDYEGGTFGAYASWMGGGGFFLNVLGKVDLLELDYSAAGDDDSADVTSYGARADLGFRFGDSLFLEPMVSVDGISTKIDDFEIDGTEIDAGSNESFRGGAGLRAGFGGETIRASATGRVWEVFENDIEVDVAGIDVSDDDLEGTYAEIAAQVDVDLSTSLLLFVRGSYLFSDDIDKPAVHGGFNWSW